MGGLTLFILATYAAQIIQVGFFSAPSAGSTVEMLFKVKRDPACADHHPAASVIRSRTKLILLIVATGVVTISSLIPLSAIVYPPVIGLLGPFMAKPSGLMQTICIVLLVFGNVLTYAAVATLRRHVSFHPFGETARLYTSGIFGYLRNPITVGLSFIYAGFVLALPSVAMLIGFIFFLLNSAYRIHMEEVYLQRAFGEEYVRYKQQVGKYFPRLGKHK